MCSLFLLKDELQCSGPAMRGRPGLYLQDIIIDNSGRISHGFYNHLICSIVFVSLKGDCIRRLFIINLSCKCVLLVFDRCEMFAGKSECPLTVGKRVEIR